ncbi:amino acid ABC transporter permease [Cellulomonas shaoxiangyii]|uniref:Amino acid ABC transporter permease n=1 Tax=Cellulomonas shaoxiangyii TaxID=2566013 RepID=A0A4P7SJD7_9CELL|nr:amino acid ABC transporter permease [Cellulomonas shaoxiangyii]QCB93931.1 amino acid ABC transporter permease [Cellulomonas shaoxiangyii]TGY86004.1 amino acid ABC transporter permease [Cellulomonas shaoxiangyii]
MSSVLYDTPGPVTRRRERIASVVAGVLVLALLGVAAWYAAGRGIFTAERWAVLYDPPMGQTASAVWRNLLVDGLGATLRAAVVAAPLALLLGLVLAVLRTTRVAPLRWLATVVIELFRGLPVLLVMLFALLAFGWDAFRAVVFGLVVYNMAIIAEIVRAGLASLPKGQTEAALAVGLSRGQALRLVLLPQALRTMLPSLVAQLVVLLKDSSLGFIVGYQELLKVIQNNTYFFGNASVVALFVVGAGVYLAVNITLSRLAMRLQGRSLRTATPPALAAAAGDGAPGLDPEGAVPR